MARLPNEPFLTLRFILALMIVVCILPAQGHSQKETAPSNKPFVDMDGLTSEDYEVRQRAVQAFLRKRQELVYELVGAMWHDPKDHSKGIRRECVYVLGRLQPWEARQRLLEALPYDPCDMFGDQITPGKCAPVLGALVSLGRDVAPDLVGYILETDNAFGREHAAQILRIILRSKTATIESLRRAQQTATDEKAKQRLRMAEDWVLARVADDDKPATDAHRGADRKESLSKQPLIDFLYETGNRLDVHFTMEYPPPTEPGQFPHVEVTKDNQVHSVESLINKLQAELPNVRVAESSGGGRGQVIHLIHSSSSKSDDYVMDKVIDFEYEGVICNLPQKLGEVAPGIEGFSGGAIHDEMSHDHITQVDVSAWDKSVRDILSIGLPLATYSRILWVAKTTERDGRQIATVRYYGPRPLSAGDTAHLASDWDTRVKAASTLLSERDSQIKVMLKNLRRAHQNGMLEERRECLFVLGQYRAKEAVPLLVSLLPDDPGPKMHGDYIDPYAEGSVAYALLQIGDAAVPELSKEVETSENPKQWQRCLRLITVVLGSKNRAEDVLTKRREQAKTEEAKQRLADRLTFLREKVQEPTAPRF